MSRRRKFDDTPPYAGATNGINAMERAVIYRTVEFDFTAEDVIHCLFPADMVETLRKAYPLALLNTYHGTGTEGFGYAGCKYSFNIQYHNCGLLRPAGDAALYQDARKFPQFMGALGACTQIVQEFEVVRGVVNWFNLHKVTPGCARYYFPGLVSLLPITHPIHAVSGERFRDMVLDAEITSKLRKVPATIAKGMLADPQHNSLKDNTRIALQIDDGQSFPFV